MGKDSVHELSIFFGKCFLPPKGIYLPLLLSYMLLHLGMCWPCSMRSGMMELLGCDTCQSCIGNGAGLQDLLLGGAGSANVQGTPACPSLRNICSSSDSFCFSSTLPSSVSEEDSNKSTATAADSAIHQNVRKSNSSWSSSQAAYKSLNGNVISCSLNLERESHNKLAANKNVDLNCGTSHTGSNNENSMVIDSPCLDGYSSPQVSISPPSMDWGLNHLYVPSLALLTVSNSCNNSILKIFEPSSTDTQFYAYNFSEITLLPGKSASIVFIFLPRWLGLSFAQLVLQTSSGGFLIRAKGIAIESSYGIEPLVGLSLSPNKRLRKNLSLYNPLHDTIYVEEIQAWIDVSFGNISHSAHAVCRVDNAHVPDGVSSQLNHDEWLTLKSGQLPLMGIKPARKWEVAPHETEHVIGIDLFSHIEGKVSGAFCMQLRSSASDKWRDMVIVPLEAEVHDRATYSSLTGSVSVLLEPLIACDDNKPMVFVLSLRNHASNLLRFVEVNEVTDGVKLFQVKYVGGLTLFPGTSTHAAVVTRTPEGSQDPPVENPGISSNCKLLIVTNDLGPQIEIPCQDFLAYSCSRDQSDSPRTTYVGFESQLENLNSGNSITGPPGNLGQAALTIKVSESTEADALILGNWRSQGTIGGMSVLGDEEVHFPTVQIGTYSSKWITINNPSQYPVVMQLVLNLGTVVDECKDSKELLNHSLLNNLIFNGSVKSDEGFSLPESAISEAYVHPYGKAIFGPINFRPSNRCLWRSSALIRNNLSGVEWLPLRGFGGSLSLVLLEGPHLIRSLEFDLNMTTPLNVSPPELLLHTKSTCAACFQPVSKELVAKNVGDLPLEVRRIKVSGIDCGSNGFMIHTCRGFALAPGESRRLMISYQTDFSSSIVHRDLELGLATGILVVPMRANFPLKVLSLCRKSFLSNLLRKLSFVVVVATSVTILVFCRVLFQAMHLGSHEVFFKTDQNCLVPARVAEKPSSLYGSEKSTRSAREVGKIDSESGRKCSDKLVSTQELGVTTQYVKQMVDKQEKICSGSENKTSALSSPICSKLEPETLFENSIAAEAPETGKLRVKTERERGRRRKRRAAGSSLTGRCEGSSSQSGNSAPSSPMSPLMPLTPRRTPRSPDIGNPTKHPIPTETNHCWEKDKVVKAASFVKVVVPEIAIKFSDNNPLPSHGQLSTPRKMTARSILLPAATFPGFGCRAPEFMAPPQFLASNSPIAPHARAPGSEVRKDKAGKIEEKSGLKKEFTYDIWGNHFSEIHLLGGSQEVLAKASDAFEGNSQSFFARGPQSLMSKTPERSVSPLTKLPIYAVNCLDQMSN